jgi:transposase
MLARSAGAAKVVLETGGIWPVFADVLEELGAEVVLAHPLRTRAIAASRVKTDRVDSAILRSSASRRPDPEPNWLRHQFVSFRAIGSIWSGCRRSSRIASTPLWHSVPNAAPSRTCLDVAGRSYLENVELPAVARRCLDGHLAMLGGIQAQIKLAKAEVRRRPANRVRRNGFGLFPAPTPPNFRFQR